MGLFDTLMFASDRPDAGIRAGAVFQTKQLGCIGRLYQVDRHDTLRRRRVGSLNSVDDANDETALVPFHGDLLLYGTGHDSGTVLVARFTDGKLTSIRQAGECPAELLALLDAMAPG